MVYSMYPIVDSNGFVVCRSAPVRIDPRTGELILKDYRLKPGELLIETDLNTSKCMLKPHWTGEAWEETATDEELAEWEASKQGDIDPSEAVDYAEFIKGMMEGFGNDE